MVLDEFRAKGMKEVREKMIVHNLPDDERKRYNRFLDNLHTEASIADTVRIEQEEKTEQKVKEEKTKWQIATAKNLIKLGLSDEQISESTGMLLIEVQTLRNNINANK